MTKKVMTEPKNDLLRDAYVYHLQMAYRTYTEFINKWYATSGFDDNGVFYHYGGELADKIINAQVELEKAMDDLLEFDERMNVRSKND